MSFLVAIRNTSERYVCRPDQTLLAGMEQLGRKGIPVGCRGGGCGVCKVLIESGAVRSERMSRCHVSTEEEAQGYVLACRVYPQSDLTLHAVDKLARCIERHAARLVLTASRSLTQILPTTKETLMAITGIIRPGHVQLRVLDIEAAVQHYRDVIGLIETARDPQGRIYLKAWDEHDHHSVVLREADTAGMDFMGFRVDSPATLEKLAVDLQASGLATDMQWIAAGEHLRTGKRFRFTVPTGHAIELFAEKEKVGNGMPYENPEISPDDLKGMAPSRFDHCLLYGDDLDGTMKLFIDVLGFQLAESVVAGPERMNIAAFLTCSTKPHDIAFIRHPEKNKFHHASFLLDNWGEVLKAADIISKKRVSLDIGPTRHGITRGETIYFFDPSGNRNEVFSGGYICYPDKPPLVWTDDELGRAIFYHDRKLNENFLSVLT